MSDADVHAAIVDIDLRLLARVLRLPEGTEIHSVLIDPTMPYTLCMRVTHPSLPLHKPGDRLVKVDLIIHEARSEFVL